MLRAIFLSAIPPVAMGDWATSTLVSSGPCPVSDTVPLTSPCDCKDPSANFLNNQTALCLKNFYCHSGGCSVFAKCSVKKEGDIGAPCDSLCDCKDNLGQGGSCCFQGACSGAAKCAEELGKAVGSSLLAGGLA